MSFFILFRDVVSLLSKRESDLYRLIYFITTTLLIYYLLSILKNIFLVYSKYRVVRIDNIIFYVKVSRRRYILLKT